MRTFRSALFAMLAAAALLPSALLSAQYPDRPIKIVVPYPPGGGGDTQVRMIAPLLSAEIGQPVVVENRPGANGALGSRQVAQAPADGYTLLFTTATQMLLTPLLVADSGYGVANFTPVAGLSNQPVFIVVPASSPIKTVADLIARGKAPGAKVSYGASSIGSLSHIIGERFNAATGTQYLAVPYKGTGPLMTAVLAGEVDYTYVVGSAAAAHVKAGTLRAIAVVDKARSPAMPDVPTLGEAGLPGFTQTAWFGLVAPAKTPKPVIDLLHRKIAGIMKRPDIKAKLAQETAEPWPLSPAELGEVLKSDAGVYARAVKFVK